MICKNVDQLGLAKKIRKIGGKKVEVVPVKKNEIKGVIYGVWADTSERKIKENIKGGKVTDGEAAQSQ